MNAIVDPAGTIGITLSRRNLVALLSKLDEPRSARTLLRRLEDGRLLVVTAESDAEHYAERNSVGVMTPQAEQAIKLHDEGKLSFI
jgi:hypothetical protein